MLVCPLLFHTIPSVKAMDEGEETTSLSGQVNHQISKSVEPEKKGHKKLHISKKKKDKITSNAIKISMNCFSDDTQILTSNGIKLIKSVKKGELVYTFNPETENLELMPVTKLYKYNYNSFISVQ